MKEETKLGSNLRTLQYSFLSWLFGGGPGESTVDTPSFSTIYTKKSHNLDKPVAKCWNPNGVDSMTSALTKAEKRCEDFLNPTVQRDDLGCFVVRLPFNQNAESLREPRDIIFRK